MYGTMYHTGALARPLYAADWHGYAQPPARRPGLGVYHDLGFSPGLNLPTALVVGAAGAALWYLTRGRKRR